MLNTVSVEKAVTVAVTFLATVEQGRQVELWVGWGQPLKPVPMPVPWLFICPGRLRFQCECEYVGRVCKPVPVPVMVWFAMLVGIIPEDPPSVPMGLIVEVTLTVSVTVVTPPAIVLLRVTV